MRMQFLLKSALIAAVLGICGPGSHAQTMDELIEQLASDARSGQQTEDDSPWGQPHSNEPLTREQAEQRTTDNLLRALTEASRQPEGETDYQRQKRLQDLTNDLRDESAAISQQENEYHRARMDRLYGPNGRTDHGGTVEYDEYVQDRTDHSTQPAANMEIPIRGTNRAHPDAKPAGFGEGYAGGFEPSQPTSAPKATGPAKRGRRQARRAGEVQQVDTQTSKPKPKKKYCACKPGDQLDFSGIMCMDAANGFSYYEKGHFPVSGYCASEVWK